MKIDRLDAHDRLLHYKKQSFDIAECCQDIVNQRPFGDHPFYIFVHSRTDDDGVTKRLIWQPRLTKPRAQTNSMLFRAYPASDLIKIIWMIPAEELWEQFEKGKMTENEWIWESIENYRSNRQFLEKPEEDDLTDKQIDQIYKDISNAAKQKTVATSLIF